MKKGEMMKEETKGLLIIIITVAMYLCIVGVGMWAEHDTQYAIKHGYHYVDRKAIQK
jgi:hypothetical protein